MDVRMAFVLFACWIVSDVNELIFEVVGISNAVLMVSAVPDFSCGLLADSEGIASFDELNAFCR
jgi:hypothetical protein